MSMNPCTLICQVYIKIKGVFPLHYSPWLSLSVLATWNGEVVLHVRFLPFIYMGVPSTAKHICSAVLCSLIQPREGAAHQRSAALQSLFDSFQALRGVKLLIYIQHTAPSRGCIKETTQLSE